MLSEKIGELRRERGWSQEELCVLSPAPTVIGGILDETGALANVGAALLLVMVAVGCFLFVRGGVILGGYVRLLKGEGHT